MKKLRVLHIEDSERDAAIIARALSNTDYDVFTERVEDAEAMREALREKAWDVILCDYSMPNFDAVSALAVLKSTELDIPCIIISGTIGEETAVSAMIAGANDYLMKDNLTRLVPAIDREIKEATNRRERKKIEAQLRTSEARLRAIFESEPECVKLLGKECETLDMNPAGLAMIGADSLEQVRGKKMSSLLLPEYRKAFAELNQKVFARESGTLEFEITGLKGKRRWLDTHATPLLDDNGEVEAHLGLTRDITESKLAEQKLREKESLLSSTQSIAHIGSWVMELSDSGTVDTTKESWSDEHYRIYGFEPGDIDITDEVFYNSVHPDDRERLANTIRESIEHKTPFDIEHRIILPDGSERIVQAIGELELDPKTGKPLKMLGSVQDITERKRAEAELIKSREHLARAQHVAKLGSWETDLSTLAVIWSDETYRIFEIDHDRFEPTHQDFLQLVHPDDREAVDKAFVDSIAQHADCSIKHRIQLPDGRIKFIKAQWAILRDADDKPVTAIGTSQDITKRTLAQASQRESEERLRLLFEQMKDGFYYSTPDGSLLDINPAMVEMFGYASREEMLKVDVKRDLYFSAEERKSQILDEGKDESEVYRMRRKDGSAIWVEDRGQYKYDEEGNVAFHQGLLRDVTERKLAEEALIDFGKHLKLALNGYERVLDNSLDVICTIDEEGRFASINKASRETWGYEPEELIGKLYIDLVHPDDLAITAQIAADVMAGNPATTFENRYLHKSGSQIQMMWSAKWLESDKKMFCVARDISERKLIENQLTESEAYKGAILESALDCIIAMDSAGLVTEFNPAAETLFGYSRDFAIGKELAGLVVPPYMRDQHRRGMEHYLSTGEGPVMGKRIEILAMRSDGFEFPVELSINAVYLSGSPVFTAYLRDISERKLAEESLIRSEQRYRDLVENAHDGIFTLDLSGTFTSANKACELITGYSFDENQGLKFQEIVAPEYVNTVQEMIVKKLEGEPVTAYGTEIVAKDGHRVAIEVNSRLILRDGIPVGVQGIARDVTERKMAEEQLKSSEQRYRDLVENAHDIIYSHDLEGNFTSMNAACEQIIGYTRDEALKLSLADTVAGGQLEKAKEMIGRKLKGEDTTAYELDIVAKGGRIVTVEVNSKLVVQDGVAVGIQGIARDVTEQKAAREQLEQTSALLRIAGQAAQLGGWTLELPEHTLIWSDENCIIHDVLPGYRPTLEEGLASYYPENRAEVQGYVTDCAENGTPYDFELPKITAKGRHIWVRSIGEAVRNTEGNIIRLQGAFQDITERKMAEESLRQKNSLIRIAGELTLTGAWALELPEKRSFWSDELFDILEFPRGETPDYSTVLELYPQPSRDEVAAGLEACANDGTPVDIEVEIFTGTGRRIWVRVVAEADRKADGTIERIHGAFQDISDRKLAEEQFRQSQKLESVGRLAGGIAHDFNNMLTAINGYSDLTLRQMEEDDPLRRNILEVRKAGERSAALTNQLLAFSRQQILQPEVVYLNRIITETGTLLERMIGEDVELILGLHPKTGRIKADPGQLTQIIMNLAVNARDAMPNGGTLTFETTNIFLDREYTSQHAFVLPGAYVKLTVSDNGTGMDAETQQRIFEPFFTTKAKGEGTGLGLAMVYGVVKQSNGHIMVYSEPGIGTTFTIYLPRVMEAMEEVEASETSDELPMGTETILLVEDEENVRVLTRQILEMCGYTVLEAANGKDALAICEKNAGLIDLIMTDVVMPQMGGRELAEKVSLNWPEMLVLFTSGYTDDAIVRHGVIKEKANFIHKPFNMEALAHKVRSILDESIAG